MAAAVDPFSVATAELSEDYIKIFQNPDTVPKYLEKLSEKTGVVVFAIDNSISVKGSWVSLKRVRSFLTEFVSSCQVTECEDNKEVDLLDFEGQPVSVAVENIHEEDNQKLDHVASFHDATGEPSDWIKWTAEVLPQIQPVRSKRAYEYSLPKTEDNMIPEPLVLYANYQPTPDPDAKVPATLDAIEKVLKTVYDSNKLKTPELSESAPTLVIDHPTTTEHTDVNTPQTKNFTEHNESVVGLTNQNQVEVSFSISGHNSPHKSEESNNGSYSATHDDDDGDGDQGTLSTVLDSPTFLPVRDAVADTVLSHHQSQLQEDSGNTNPGQSSSTLARKQSKGMPKRQSRGKRKDNKLNVDYSGEVLSVTEFRNKDCSKDQVTVHTNSNKMYTSSVQSDSKVKETRRKGRPRKTIKYQSETSVSNKDTHPENVPLIAERATKRRNLMPIQAVLPKPSPALSARKKPGKSQQSLKHEVVVNEKGKGFGCELCPYVAKKLNHLREHRRRVHITKDKEFKCEECSKVFGFGKDLKRHCRTHQRAENCCDICGKMYKGVRNLAEHKKTHETDYIKPEFPCEFCQKVFSTKYVLAYHIKSEHLGMKKTFICPTCGKSFSQKNSYLQHANVHMGIKPYQCDICGRSFSYEKSLKEHKFMHQDDKQFECHVCHKKFRQSSGVAIHMRIHKERKDYVCSACGKGFSQKQAMIRHERIHAGEKPFTCSLCKRSFTDSSILRRHMILIHKKEKDKWQEDTENNVQRRTDFFISVVSKEMEKGQTSHQDAGDHAVKMSENNSVQEVARTSAVEPECFIDDNTSCDAKDAGDFNIIPVGDGTVTSMPQLMSSSDLSTTVLSTVPSVSLPQFSKASHEAANCHSDTIMPLVGIPNPLAAGIQHAVHDLQPDTVFSMALETAQSNHIASLSQPVCVSLPNETQISLQEQTSVLSMYHAFSEPNPGSSSEICSAQLQQSSTSAANLPVYPGMVDEDHADYQPHTLIMSDALAATVQFHAGVISGVSSSQEQTDKCEDLLTDPSILQ